MWDSYLSIGLTEVVNGTRLRRNIATGPCPTGMFKPLECDPIGRGQDILGGDGEEMTFQNIAAAPWYDPQIPASGLLLGFDFDGAGQVGLGDTRRSVSALEGLADGQIFTSTRSQGREARFTVVAAGLSQGALEYARSWLSAVLDGSFCGEGGDPCDLFDVTFFSECPPDLTEFPDATKTPPYNTIAWSNALSDRTRKMLQCSTVSGPIPGEIFVADGGMWTQRFEFTIGSELPGTYSVSKPLSYESIQGPSPIIEFHRNVIENPRGVGAGPIEEVGRNLVPNPSFETNASSWSVASFGGPASAITRVAKPAGLPGHGSWAGTATMALPPSSTSGRELSIRSADIAVTAGEALRIALAFGAKYSGQARYLVQAEFKNAADSRVSLVTIYSSGSVGSTTDKTVYDMRSLRTAAPTGATKVQLQVRVIQEGAVGVSGTRNFALWADAAQVLSGKIADIDLFPESEVAAMQPYGSSAPVNGLVFTWAGAANASQTILSVVTPDRWRKYGSAAASSILSRINFGGRDAVLYRCGGGTGPAAGAAMELHNVTPGMTYFPSISLRGWGMGHAVVLAVKWFDSSGALISETDAAGGPGFNEDVWITFSGDGVEAPAGAVRAAVVTRPGPLKVRYLMTNAMLNPLQPSTFFDGDTADTQTRDFEWEGTRHASASSSTPIMSTVIVDPLADPACPPAPVPPRPPTIEETCGEVIQSWSRYYYRINPTHIPEKLSMFPVFRLTEAAAMEAARLYLLPNPENLHPDALATDPIAAWNLSYLPPEVPLVIDMLHQSVTAYVGGVPLPADHLLTGAKGQPLVWPTLSCGQGYVLVIETPYEAGGPGTWPILHATGTVMFK